VRLLVRPRSLAFLLGLACVFTNAQAQVMSNDASATPRAKPVDRPPSVDYSASRERGTPRYPQEALGRRQSGSVLLKVLVDANGNAATVEIEQGAGHRYFDDAAIDAVRHWVFRPGLKNGRPVGGWLLLPIDFTPPPIPSRR
jgi:protein TonB